MSDLISRSQLLKEIEKYKFGAISNDTEREYIKSTILDFIICQPIAYDIDKVIEEIEAYGRNTDVCISKVKAIEIVKQGGVSDDVCELSADKIKVTSLEVIVTGSKRKPYYEIKYKELGTDNYNIGYSSYNLDFVLDWKDKCFELVKVVE